MLHRNRALPQLPQPRRLLHLQSRHRTYSLRLLMPRPRCCSRRPQQRLLEPAQPPSSPRNSGSSPKSSPKSGPLPASSAVVVPVLTKQQSPVAPLMAATAVPVGATSPKATAVVSPPQLRLATPHQLAARPCQFAARRRRPRHPLGFPRTSLPSAAPFPRRRALAHHWRPQRPRRPPRPWPLVRAEAQEVDMPPQAPSPPRPLLQPLP